MLLHHLVLGSSEPAQLADFYESALGLRRLRCSEDELGCVSVWLELGAGLILMVERCSVEQAPLHWDEDLHRRGPFFFAFACTPEHRDAQLSSLMAAGAQLESRGPCTDYYRDPQGNRFGLSSYPEARHLSLEAEKCAVAES